MASSLFGILGMHIACTECIYAACFSHVPWSVSVYWTKPWAVLKWLNSLRWCFACGPGWAQWAMYLVGGRIPLGKRQFCGHPMRWSHFIKILVRNRGPPPLSVIHTCLWICLVLISTFPRSLNSGQVQGPLNMHHCPLVIALLKKCSCVVWHTSIIVICLVTDGKNYCAKVFIDRYYKVTLSCCVHNNMLY